MDAELKAKWVEALRSGKYQQLTPGGLREGDRFCCLGVLCDIAAPSGWTLHRFAPNCAPALFHTYGSGYLRMTGLQVLGLTPAQQASLADMNDAGVPFAMIADKIERAL
jgi:hypothetical protein